MDQYWNPMNGGVFLYTSSGAVYGDPPVVETTTTNTSSPPTGPYMVTEQTPVAIDTSTPRIQRLVQAEQIVLQQNNGYCLRLAGLYNLHRGPHNYWLTSHKKDTIASTSHGMVNLLHYEDAANACFQALLQLGSTSSSSPPPPPQQKVLLISDGVPITRYQICQYAKMARYYQNCTIPQFVVETSTDEKHPDAYGKVYNGSYSNQILQWQPKYPSFQQYMLDHA